MAGKIDLEIDKGATYRKTFYWQDSLGAAINITGYTGRMQIRKSINSSSFIAELTTENGGMTLTGPEGKIELFISDTDTSSVVENSGVYDIELISAGSEITKFCRGSVAFPEEVTRT